MILVHRYTIFSKIQFPGIRKSCVFILSCLAFDFVHQNIPRYDLELVSKKFKCPREGVKFKSQDKYESCFSFVCITLQVKTMKGDNQYS